MKIFRISAHSVLSYHIVACLSLPESQVILIHHPHSSSTLTPRTTHYPQPTAQGPLPAAAAQERMPPLRPAPPSAAR